MESQELILKLFILFYSVGIENTDLKDNFLFLIFATFPVPLVCGKRPRIAVFWLVKRMIQGKVEMVFDCFGWI